MNQFLYSFEMEEFMLSVVSNNILVSRPRPSPPTCSICSMTGHNRRGCHLNPTHMNGENVNSIRYRSHEIAHRNIMRQRPPPPPPRPMPSRIRDELNNIALVLQRGNNVSSSPNNIISKSEDLIEPVHNVFVSENCPICMETLGKTNVITTRCGHQLCVGCFTRNLIEAKSNKCPVCRIPIV